MTALEVVNDGERPKTLALVRPAAAPLALLELHKEIAEVIGKLLTKGTDYGVIPGTGEKPVLLKPGAERLAFAFGCFPRYEIMLSEVEHDRAVNWIKRKKDWFTEKGRKQFRWIEESGTSLGLYRYVVRCTLVRRDDGGVIAEGVGSCSTMESKYVDRPRDSENTVLKMAEKRALIAAALNGFALSDRFTQDMEDFTPSGGDGTPPKSEKPTEQNGGPATEEQVEALLTLADRVEVPDAMRDKIKSTLEQGITASRAQKWIGEIEEVIKTRQPTPAA